jgi:adenylate cyclase
MDFSRTKSIPLIFKLTASISLLVISAISLISLTTMNKQRTLQNQQIQDFGNAMALQLAASATEAFFINDNLSLEVQLNNFLNLPRVEGVAIIDSEQNILIGKGDIGSTNALYELTKQSSTDNPPISYNNTDHTLLVAAPIIFRDVTGGHVAIKIKAETIASGYTDTLYLLLVVGVTLAIIAAIAAYYISRHISLPITKLLAVTDQLESGKHKIDKQDRRYDEIGRLTEAINSMSQGLYRKNQVEALLDQFLAKDIAHEVLHQLDTVKVGGERVVATVLFADIVGFTSMSEKMSPEEVAEFLNEWFNYFTICASSYFGTVDKFIGDCVMVMFGAPKKKTHHAFYAIACATLMQRLARSVNAKRRQENKASVELRIGINTGPMLAGVLGTEQRKEYTVVGDSVNLASRLCAEATAGQTIISRGCYKGLTEQEKITVNPYKKIRVRGKEIPIDTYIVDTVRQEHQLAMDSLIEDVLSKSN